MLNVVWHHRQRRLSEGSHQARNVFDCVCVHAHVRVEMFNELETRVRLKRLVISPGRWEPGAEWIKWLPGWLTNTISPYSETEMRAKRKRAGESGNNKKKNWGGWVGGTKKRQHNWIGETCRRWRCALLREDRGIEGVLLALMKKYSGIEVTGWRGQEWWGEWKETSSASLVSFCSHHSHPYLGPHRRWQQHA